jgi:hypothetical protein
MLVGALRQGFCRVPGGSTGASGNTIGYRGLSTSGLTRTSAILSQPFADTCRSKSLSSAVPRAANTVARFRSIFVPDGFDLGAQRNLIRDRRLLRELLQ